MATNYNPVNSIPGVEIQREQTRTKIALIALYSYLGLLGLIIIIGWWVLSLKVEDVLKVLTAIAGILGGIVGAIIGFYFRDNEKE